MQMLQLQLTWKPQDLSDVNIGSGDDLLPDGTKQLLEPMLTQFSVAIWRP